MDIEIDRSRLERTIRERLGETGIVAERIFLDKELNTIIALCAHITDGMKLFISSGTMSLGATMEESMVSVHRLVVNGKPMALIVVQCRECAQGGMNMLLGDE